MGKLALNFICKDESHVIEKMLNSAKGIVDLIVVNDTGSTDGTQQIIKNFGEKHNIPTYVFERPFDDFEKSRTWAMEKLKEVVKELEWDPSKVHGFWFDCDEQLVIDSNFAK
jgi:glycosyltransferase involved in cell wall biosynthesis